MKLPMALLLQAPMVLSGVKFDVTFSGKRPMLERLLKRKNAIAAAATAVLNLLAIPVPAKGKPQM